MDSEALPETVKATVPAADATSKVRSAETRIADALQLLDYAINHNLQVPDEVIKRLEGVRAPKETEAGDNGFDPSYQPLSSEERDADIDMALRDLTAITYPTTIESLAVSKSAIPGLLANWTVALIALLLLLAVISYSELQRFEAQSKLTAAPTRTVATTLVGFAAGVDTSSPLPRASTPSSVSSAASPSSPDSALYKSLWRLAFAVSLGGLGALFYLGYNLIGVISESTFRPGDLTAHAIRFLLGLAIGAIFAIEVEVDSTKPYMLLLPFLGGFSTRLVVGIITQAIQAVELTLGIDSRNAELQRRRTQTGAAGAGGSTT